MQFKDVVGHADLKARLIKSVSEGRIAHAQLFAGARGTGNLPLALAYAQYLLCTNRTDGDSCGQCPSCRKAAKLEHPDLHLVFPMAAEKTDMDPTIDPATETIGSWRQAVLANPYLSEAEWYNAIDMKNKQGLISTAVAAHVIKALSLKSYESEYKVMIIWLAERMNIAAANKLLKIIEEPPAKTVFLLVSENPTLLLKTITSRTQQITVPPIDEQSMAQALEQRMGVDPTQAANMAHIACGSYSKAQMLCTTPIGEHYERYVQLMRLCYANKYLDLLAWAENTAKLNREEIKDFINYALDITRNSLMLNLGLPELCFSSNEEQQFVQKFSPYIHRQNIEKISSELNAVNEHIARNANASIVFTDFVLKLSQIIGNK